MYKPTSPLMAAIGLVILFLTVAVVTWELYPIGLWLLRGLI